MNWMVDKLVDTMVDTHHFMLGLTCEMGGKFLFCIPPQPSICYTNSMRLALLVSMLVACLALNAETIQGKVVRVSDGDTITVLSGATWYVRMIDNFTNSTQVESEWEKKVDLWQVYKLITFEIPPKENAK